MRVTRMIGLGLAAVLLAATTPSTFAAPRIDCRGTSDAFGVNTMVSSSVVIAGGFGNGAFAIDNHSALTANVTFNLFIEYADGMMQQLTGLGSPVTLGPGQSLVQFISFIVPLNAAQGQALFACKACASFRGVPPSSVFGLHTTNFTVQ